ncbi:MAG: NUDIX domain-containing protein [Chloroflexi bacterium]|nr:NUDIX domain-containing protein [Chloroflexota bacterium]MBU1660614.1 NUDIX domain-containing protein [Chloroflexota bacterium]
MESQHRMGGVRPVCPGCGWIFFPDPKVAAAAFVMQDGEVLLTRRANTPKRGLWTLPVGFVDAGEDPARTAERECLEETGLRVRVTNLLDVISGQAHPRGAHILIVYRAEILGGELHPGDDVDRAGFFNPDEIPPLAFESTEQILERFL